MLAAVSIPLKNFDLAAAAAERDGKVTQIHPGVLRLPGKHGDKEPCDLAMAAGDAPARLVCGAGERDLDALRGWLVRGLSRTSPDTTDLVATLRAKPLKDRYLGRLRAEAAKLGDQARAGLGAQGVLDPELLVAPAIALDEGVKLIEDLDRFDFRTSLVAKPPGLVVSGALRFGAESSWLTRAITSVNVHAGPPPPMFWRAPKDARAATWGRGGDPHLYDGVRSVLHRALAEVLTRAPLDPGGQRGHYRVRRRGAERAGELGERAGLGPTRGQAGNGQADSGQAGVRRADGRGRGRERSSVREQSARLEHPWRGGALRRVRRLGQAWARALRPRGGRAPQVRDEREEARPQGPERARVHPPHHHRERAAGVAEGDGRVRRARDVRQRHRLRPPAEQGLRGQPREGEEEGARREGLADAATRHSCPTAIARGSASLPIPRT